MTKEIKEPQEGRYIICQCCETKIGMLYKDSFSVNEENLYLTQDLDEKNVLTTLKCNECNCLLQIRFKGDEKNA